MWVLVISSCPSLDLFVQYQVVPCCRCRSEQARMCRTVSVNQIGSDQETVWRHYVLEETHDHAPFPTRPSDFAV